MPSVPHRIQYTSSALTGDDYRDKIDAAQAFCARHGIAFGVQVHNVAPLPLIESLHATGVALSYHGPNCSEYFVNLANRDFGYAQESITRTAEIIARFGGDSVVFHGFLMTDYPVLAFNTERSYTECMRPAFREELIRPGTNLCADFLATDEYLQRQQLVKERLAQIAKDFPDITWCIENDYPAYGAGLFLAEQVVGLDAPLCLDVSHLWIACLLFEKDFFEQAEMIARTGRVKCVHLHSNPIQPGAPISDYRDGHLSLNHLNAIDLPRLTRILQGHGIDYWVIETSHADLADLQTLNDWLS